MPTFIHTLCTTDTDVLYTSAKQAAKLSDQTNMQRMSASAWKTIWISGWTFKLMLESCHFKRPANVEIDLKYGICTQFFVFVILIKSKFTAFDGLIFQASYLMWVRERGKNLRSLFDQYVFKFVCTHRQTADALLYVCTATNKKKWWNFCFEQLQRQIIYQQNAWIFKRNWLIPSPPEFLFKV